MFRVRKFKARVAQDVRPLKGAIAQLGERLHGMQEVGGSIPPGSTTLRPSGFAWRSHEMPAGRSVVPGVARRAKTGRCCLPFPTHIICDVVGPPATRGAATRCPQGEDGLVQSMWYVYIIRSANFPEQEYIGATGDLKRRLPEHNAGKSAH